VRHNGDWRTGPASGPPIIGDEPRWWSEQTLRKILASAWCSLNIFGQNFTPCLMDCPNRIGPMWWALICIQTWPMIVVSVSIKGVLQKVTSLTPRWIFCLYVPHLNEHSLHRFRDCTPEFLDHWQHKLYSGTYVLLPSDQFLCTLATHTQLGWPNTHPQWHAAPNLQWPARKTSGNFESSKSYCNGMQERPRHSG